jgi:hypothetical protein
MATKKPSQLDLLKKLIREEVVSAIRQEMPAILKEIQSPNSQKEVIKESKKVKTSIPGTLNTQPVRPTPNFSGNPLASLLNETAMNMGETDEMSFTTGNLTEDAIGIDPNSFFQPKQVSVGDVNGMLATARPSSDPSMVQINEVPDFTDLMSKMRAKGVM